MIKCKSFESEDELTRFMNNWELTKDEIVQITATAYYMPHRYEAQYRYTVFFEVNT